MQDKGKIIIKEGGQNSGISLVSLGVLTENSQGGVHSQTS